MIIKEVPVPCQWKKKLCSISGNDDNFPISKFYLLETLVKLVFALFNVGLLWWNLCLLYLMWGFPGDSEGKVASYNAGGPRFHPWVRKTPWRRTWQPNPVFSSREFHGQRSLVGYSPWGRKESGTTEWQRFHFQSPLKLHVIVCTFHKWRTILGKPEQLFKQLNSRF